MAAVITANLPMARDNVAPSPATREDGSNYRWRMFFDGGARIADADYPAELLDILIPGYEYITTEEVRLEARIALAKNVQQLARAVIVGGISPEDAEKLTDWEWNVLNYGDDENPDPFGWGEGDGEIGVEKEDVVDIWSSDVPLVLIETSYRPFTEIQAPLSNDGDFYDYVRNLIWLRPIEEVDFLKSLSRIGVITFGTPTSTPKETPKAH